jgi:hypothetical protein
MDTKPVVNPDIQLGEVVRDALLADPVLNVRAMMWWFDDSKQQLLYTLTTPVYEQRGAQAAYLRVRKVLEANQLLDKLPLDRVWIIDDRHPVLELIRNTFGQPESSLFSGIVINHTVLPDLYVYKIAKRRSHPRKKMDGNNPTQS